MTSYLSHFLGDILGSAMRNTQNLLQMPYGCGEQNMALFAPNIYVLDYLNETQQLTAELKSKAIHYLNTGEWLNKCMKTLQCYFNNRLDSPVGLSYLSVLWYVNVSFQDIYNNKYFNTVLVYNNLIRSLPVPSMYAIICLKPAKEMWLVLPSSQFMVTT